MSTLRLRFDQLQGGPYKDLMKEEGKKIARAATGAFREVAGNIKQEGRAQIATALSSRFANAFNAKAYPEQGDSLSPAIVAGLKIKYASVFEGGATIAGKPLLWLPLDAAPLGRGGKRMSPAEYVKNVGVLYSINHPGKPPLLAAVVRQARPTKLPSLRALKRGRNPGGKGSVRLIPLYVGVPTVNDPSKYNVTQIIQKWADRLVPIFDAKWEEIDG